MKIEDMNPGPEVSRRMRSAVLEHIDPKRRKFRFTSKRENHRRVVGFATIFVTLGLVMGTTGVATAEQLLPFNDRNNNPMCYGAASLSAENTEAVGIDADRNEKTLDPIEKRVRTAKGACAAAWRVWSFSGIPVEQQPDNDKYPVPPLTVCMFGDGRLAAFPNVEGIPERAFCHRLKLSSPL